MQTSCMSVQRGADLRLHLQRRSKLCVVEHCVKISSTNVNILDSEMDARCDVSDYSARVTDSGIWRNNRACKHRACPYNDVRTSDFTCKDAQNYVSWNIA